MHHSGHLIIQDKISRSRLNLHYAQYFTALRNADTLLLRKYGTPSATKINDLYRHKQNLFRAGIRLIKPDVVSRNCKTMAETEVWGWERFF